MNDALDEVFTELFSTNSVTARTHRIPFDGGVCRLVRVPLTVEDAVQPCIPALLERGGPTRLDKWSLSWSWVRRRSSRSSNPSSPANAEMDSAFHFYLWCNLRIVFSRRGQVKVENGGGCGIDQQRCPQLLDGEVRSIRIVS